MRFYLISMLLLILATRQAIGQTLKLSGRLQDHPGDSIEINAPFDGNYYKNNSFYIHPDAKGNFSISLPSRKPRFFFLLYKGHSRLLLLSPGRALHISIAGDSERPLFVFSENAKTENDLIQKLHLADLDSLYFIRQLRLRGSESYISWPVDSIIGIKLPEILCSLDSSREWVRRSKLDQSLKGSVYTELRYHYAVALMEGLSGWLANPGRKDRKAFFARYIDTVLSVFPLPDAEDLDRSPHANTYLEVCAQYRMMKLIYDYGQDPNKHRADSLFRENTGVSIQDLQASADDERYTIVTRAKSLLPAYAWEKQLANLMIRYCATTQLEDASKLLRFIRSVFPGSAYLPICEAAYAPLKQRREQYAGNRNIRIRPGYQNIRSLKDMLAPYQGKIILLDLWFMECPPCQKDLPFETSLKNRLRGKDIVFLYVAAEEDKRDGQWRDYILINQMTGEHIRKTPAEMERLWNELGVGEESQGYPRYFIIDRSGNIKNNNAERPSNGDSLFKQLAEAVADQHPRIPEPQQ